MMRKDMVIIMKRMKGILGDIFVGVGCIASVVIFFFEVCNWMMYV